VTIALSLLLASSGAMVVASCGSFQGQTEPAVDGGTDAADATSGEGGTSTTDTDSGLDAGPHDGSFPEAAPPPPMPGTSPCNAGITTSSICDNFDGMGAGGGIAAFWSGNLGQPNADKSTYVTPPGSLRASAPFQMTDALFVGLEAPLTVADNAMIQIDFDYAVEIDANYTELVQVRVSDLDTARFLLAPHETTTMFATALPDGGAGDSLRASTQTDTRGAWHHVHLELTFSSSAGSGKASMKIDANQQLDSTMTGVTYPTSKPTTVKVRIGDGPGAASGPSLVNIDNFYARTF
jgi:hypothetical protein